MKECWILQFKLLLWISKATLDDAEETLTSKGNLGWRGRGEKMEGEKGFPIRTARESRFRKCIAAALHRSSPLCTKAAEFDNHVIQCYDL